MGDIVELNGFEKRLVGGGDYFTHEHWGCEVAAQLVSTGALLYMGISYPTFPGFGFSLRSFFNLGKYSFKLIGITALNDVMVINPAYSLTQDACNWVVDKYIEFAS